MCCIPRFMPSLELWRLARPHGARRSIHLDNEGGSNGLYYDLTGCTPNMWASMGFSGTSAAAPYVAGTAALLKHYRPQLTNEDVEQVMKLNATNFLQEPFERHVGYGLVRADSALMEVFPPKSIMHLRVGGPASHFTIGQLRVDTLPQSVSVTFEEVSGVLHGTFPCTRYRLGGTGTFPFPFAQIPRVWVRAATSQGARDTAIIDQIYEVPFGLIISPSATSVRVRTFVYWVGPPANTWYPVDTLGARVDLTVIGQLAGTVAMEESSRPTERVLRIVPNPVVRSAEVRLTVPLAGKSRAEIFDLAGRRVATLADGLLTAGEHTFRWDGRALAGSSCPAGVYFLRFASAQEVLISRFVLLGNRP
ncbi:MAG: S8 family serine peptidase [Acidimicrobiia bacterium]